MVPARDVLRRVIEEAVASRPPRWRMRTLMRLMAVSRELRAVVRTTPALWRDVLVPAAGDKASDAVCRCLASLPRNTVISLTAVAPLPLNHAFLEALEAHGDSLQAVVCARQNHASVPGVFSRWRPAWAAARALITLSLTVDVCNAPIMPTLPPLPALRNVFLDLRQATLAAAPAFIGIQPAMVRLRVYAETRDPAIPPGTPSPILTGWLAQQPSLQKLGLSFVQGDLHDVLRPVCALDRVTEITLSVFDTPSSYVFARAFPNVEQVAIHVHRRRPPAAGVADAPMPAHGAPLPPFQTWTKLRVASLKRVPLGPFGGPLRHLTTLEKLHLDRCGLTTTDELRHLTRLRLLCVADAVVSLHGVGALTALTSLSVLSPVLDDAGDLHQLAGLRDLAIDGSQWFFPTPWHVPSFTAPLKSVWASRYAAAVMHAETVAPMPALQTMHVHGGTMDEVGPLMERGAESAVLRRLRWTGTVTADGASRFPRAAAAIASTINKRKRE